MKYVSATDIGLVREENQDMVKVEEFYGNLLAVVCDGMGGENDGKKASNTAVGEFLNQYLLSENDGKPDDFFEKAIVSANSAICSFTDKNGNMVCAGTTVVCILIADGLLRWASVGDSDFIYCVTTSWFRQQQTITMRFRCPNS